MVDLKFYDHLGPMGIDSIIDSSLYKLVSPRSQGEQAPTINHITSLGDASEQDLVYMHNSKYMGALKESRAIACITSPEFRAYAPQHMFLLVTDNPYYLYSLAIRKLYRIKTDSSKFILMSEGYFMKETAKIGKNCIINPGAVIEANAVIGDNCVIGAGAFIGQGVRIGNGCIIGANVVIKFSLISDNVRIDSNTVIGEEGFGFATNVGKHERILHIGRVIIQRDVSIGSCATVDRGSTGDTIIGENCQIDNLVQIAHNVKLGKGCVVVAQSGISGSSVLEDYCVMGGQSGVFGHVKLGKNTQVAARSVITKDWHGVQALAGHPAMPIKEWQLREIAIRKLQKP